MPTPTPTPILVVSLLLIEASGLGHVVLSWAPSAVGQACVLDSVTVVGASMAVTVMASSELVETVPELRAKPETNPEPL